MKNTSLKIVSVFLLLVVIISCNSKSDTSKNKEHNKTTVSEKQSNNSLLVCDLLTENYIKSIFPDATNFKQTSMDKPYPSCSYRFVSNGTNYKFGMTMVKKYASEKNFNRAMESMKSKKTSLQGIGKTAYYFPSLGQVSLFDGNYIIHINANKEEKGDKEMAIRITKDILSKL